MSAAKDRPGSATPSATKGVSLAGRRHVYQESLALIIRGECFHVWNDQNNKYFDCFGGPD